jgi:Tfp pilus assembly protein PilF
LQIFTKVHTIHKTPKPISPIHQTSHMLTTDYSRIPKCIMIGSLFLLFVMFTACTHHTKRHPQPLRSSHDTQSQASMVEQQLLETIHHAENLEPGNPLLLSSLYSLANFYHNRKEYEKAAEQYQQALHIKEAVNGPSHPDIATLLQRYARLLQDAKRPTEAANMLARADAILARSSRKPHTQ